jgi:hypothetical protein
MEDQTADQTGTEGTEGQQAATPTIEELAAKQGWNSDYDGPDKIDAAEFVRRKPLFDRIQSQNNSIKRLEKLVEGMAGTFKTATDAQYKKGIQDAEARMVAAEGAFDVAAFKQASADKQKLEQAQAAHVSAPAGEPAEVTEFCERNPWFEKDPAMRTDALDYRENYLRRNPNAPIKDVLAYVEKKIARDYPEVFKKPDADDDEPKPARRASAVEGSTASPKGDPLAKLKASMTGEEKHIMAMFTKNGQMTEKEFLESYSAVREK